MNREEELLPLPTKSKERKCSVPKCTTRHYAQDYCKKHYTQFMRHGKLTPEKERGNIRICKVEGCGRTDTIHHYCRKHARQLRVHNRLTPEREHIMGFEGCRVNRCPDPHRAKGFCARHYNQDRWRKLKAVVEQARIITAKAAIKRKKAEAKPKARSKRRHATV